MKCPKCKGSGKGWVSMSDSWYGYRPPKEGWCDLCSGTGKVKYVGSQTKFECERCGGSGTITEPIYKKYRTGATFLKGHKEIKCPACRGKGVVKRKKVKYYEPKY